MQNRIELGKMAPHTFFLVPYGSRGFSLAMTLGRTKTGRVQYVKLASCSIHTEHPHTNFHPAGFDDIRKRARRAPAELRAEILATLERTDAARSEARARFEADNPQPGDLVNFRGFR
jgi:hypothetical protein